MLKNLFIVGNLFCMEELLAILVYKSETVSCSDSTFRISRETGEPEPSNIEHV